MSQPTLAKASDKLFPIPLPEPVIKANLASKLKLLSIALKINFQADNFHLLKPLL